MTLGKYLFEIKKYFVMRGDKALVKISVQESVDNVKALYGNRENNILKRNLSHLLLNKSFLT